MKGCKLDCGGIIQMNENRVYVLDTGSLRNSYGNRMANK
jgi:hypothetical protein